MAIRMYVNESMAYRVTGHIQEHLEGFSWENPGAAQVMLKAVEEFAAECSFIKIFGSETLDYVVDEALQIHGGYGYHQDYAVERAYRDSRINRIFEGTNEINRLLATGMLLKRAKKGALPLFDIPDSLPGFLLKTAHQKFGDSLDAQQEVVAGITDVLMNTFAMQSATLRARQSNRENALEMAAVFAEEATTEIETSARTVLGFCQRGAPPQAVREPVDTISLRRKIAARLIQSGRYVV
jgi:alkylation response protein AidB-like acyl-CoA dehydrogenase